MFPETPVFRYNLRGKEGVMLQLTEGQIKAIESYLKEKKSAGLISGEFYKLARENVFSHLESWQKEEIITRLVPGFAEGLRQAFQEGRIDHIIYSYLDEIAFGTGGIRGLVAFTEKELEDFARRGNKSAILRGPNTINEVVLLHKSAGVARYAASKKLRQIVIGYDNRVQGRFFAELVTSLFLREGLDVYLFDRVCSFPELTFAIPYLKADMGILISASHNDKRYNGYKLVSATGAQFSVVARNEIYENFIKKVSLAEIKLAEPSREKAGRLTLIGGKTSARKDRKVKFIDIQTPHLAHIKNFIVDKDLVRKYAKKIFLGYSAFHGAGRFSVPKILKDLGFSHLKVIHSLNKVDGLFPCFLLEQQPDPGDPVAASIAVKEFIREYGRMSFRRLDLLIGTDPDADRTGIIIKVPASQKKVYKEILARPSHILLPKTLQKPVLEGDWLLLDADLAWSILLWYRLEKKRLSGGDFSGDFIVMNHCTSDALAAIALKYGAGVIKTWVGFAMISECIERVWGGEEVLPEKYPHLIYQSIAMEGRRINIGAFEQSNGFSIFGGPPRPGERLGENGHVRDKDGTLAAVLLAEVAAYARQQGSSLLELIDRKIYLDPQIGLFANYYEPEPYWGQYEGFTGLSRKIQVLRKADEIARKVESGESVSLGEKKITRVEIYRTGKYDQLHHWKGFPDEGIRYFFGEGGLNYLTIRPSGTSQCLRIHIQLKAEDVNEENLLFKKKEIYSQCKETVRIFRQMIGLK